MQIGSCDNQATWYVDEFTRGAMIPIVALARPDDDGIRADIGK